MKETHALKSSEKSKQSTRMLRTMDTRMLDEKQSEIIQ